MADSSARDTWSGLAILIPCIHCCKSKTNYPFRKNTLHKFVCPVCKKPTYVLITENYEIRLLSEDEICPQCRGTGVCPHCKGFGETICDKCGGRGYYEHRTRLVKYYCGCEECGGSMCTDSLAKVSENIKRGKGRVPCRQCRGTGRCPACGGHRIRIP